jgi:hypothetical protein
MSMDIDYVNQPASKLVDARLFWCIVRHGGDSAGHVTAAVRRVQMDGKQFNLPRHNNESRDTYYTDELKGLGGVSLYPLLYSIAQNTHTNRQMG